MNSLDGGRLVGHLGQRGTRVFLGEDDHEMRRLLASALRRDGHQVFERANGLDLLAVVESQQPAAPRAHRDVVVTDVRMPGATGLEVLAALRSRDLLIPVVIITGFGDPETHAEAWRLGAAAVFDKPFALAELRQTVFWLAVADSRPDNSNGVE